MIYFLLKILRIEQLYNKLSTTKLLKCIWAKVNVNSIVNTYNTKGWENSRNLRLIKPNTTLMVIYYINTGIKLSNQLSLNIKQIDNIGKFKLTIQNIWVT